MPIELEISSRLLSMAVALVPDIEPETRAENETAGNWGLRSGLALLKRPSFSDDSDSSEDANRSISSACSSSSSEDDADSLGFVSVPGFSSDFIVDVVFLLASGGLDFASGLSTVSTGAVSLTMFTVVRVGISLMIGLRERFLRRLFR